MPDPAKKGFQAIPFKQIQPSQPILCPFFPIDFFNIMYNKNLWLVVKPSIPFKKQEKQSTRRRFNIECPLIYSLKETDSFHRQKASIAKNHDSGCFEQTSFFAQR